jgi:hypothetical protein
LSGARQATADRGRMGESRPGSGWQSVPVGAGAAVAAPSSLWPVPRP